MSDDYPYNEDFFNKYGWCSCYECDEVFYSIDELIKHEKTCDCFGTTTSVRKDK